MGAHRFVSHVGLITGLLLLAGLGGYFWFGGGCVCLLKVELPRLSFAGGPGFLRDSHCRR